MKSKVHAGMTRKEVEQALGQPQSFGPTGYIYSDQDNVGFYLIVRLKDGVVTGAEVIDRHPTK